jgi:magnesium-transporting ATPase (P-type)
MDRPPRPRHEPLITRRLLGRAWLLMGSVSAVLALGTFFLTLYLGGWHWGADTSAGTPLHHVWQQATTATFLTIVACQVGTAAAARTDRASLRSVGIFSNRLLLAGVVFELAFAAALVYLPGVDTVFGTTAPPALVFALLIPCPFLVWGVDELYRAHGRRQHHVRGSTDPINVAPSPRPQAATR